MNWTEDDYKSLMNRQKQGRKSAAPATAKQKLQALGRLKDGELNKTEQSYADHLEWRRHCGEIVWYKFECMKFRLADNTFYTPDFIVMVADGALEAHEVKGVWIDDARVKIKVAAALFPLRFIGVQAVPKKEGGGWRYEDFSRS